MRLTLFTAGSQGDVQPCLLLGRALQRAGFDVVLAAPENFAGLGQDYGLRFHPLRGDVQQIMAGETGREFMETGGTNPLRSILAMRKLIGPIAQQMAEDALAACRDSQALLSLGVFAPFGKSIAAIRGIPLVNLEPTPLLPTRAFPAPGFPLQHDLGGPLNRLSGFAMLQVIWQWYRPFVNAFRQDHGLQPLKGSDFYRILSTTPLLGAYSPRVLPPPADWPAAARPTGYWFQETPPAWRPPAELEAFLEQGEPPVYAGFGSMGGRNPERLTRIVLQALAKSGQRGVLLTGWGGMKALDVPEQVCVVEAAPHSWLFPRMAAVVHHGGAGTTAEGLRAGAPTIIVPFIVDQAFWGRRVQALGVGPAPIPAKNLTADRLAEAIRAATQDAEMKGRAAALGAAIRAEDGLGNAVEIVSHYLGAG